MKAEVWMGRCQRSIGADIMALELRVDYPSPGVRLRKHRVELSLGDFSLALTGRGGVKGEYEQTLVMLDGGEPQQQLAQKRLAQLEQTIEHIRAELASIPASLARLEVGDFIGRQAFEGAALDRILRMISAVEPRPCDEPKDPVTPAAGSPPRRSLPGRSPASRPSS